LGGDFTSFNGTGRNRIVRLNANGSLDASLNPGTGANNTVFSILIQSDGKIIIGGAFTTYNSVGKNRIARLNSSGANDATFNPGTGASNTIWAAALESGGKIIIGGNFATYNGATRNGVARIANCITTSSSLSATACDSYLWYGTTYYATSTPTHVLPNMAGCDSTITLNLTIISSSAATQTVTACDTFSWFGTTYSTSGTPTHIIPNTAGCDSITTLLLTINHSKTSVQNITACETYTWHGTTYTANATAIHIMPTTAGCDSTITLNLTINHHTAASVSIAACDSYTAPDGIIHTTSGIKTATIPNHAGCDSTITINLTITNSSFSTQTMVTCDSATWFGTSYTTSGMPTHVVPNMAGCDSTITLDLTIIRSTAATQTITACKSYTWFGTTYSASGTSTYVLPNVAGCDSTITLNLTIDSVNVSVILSDPTITASANGATYQWIDCNAAYSIISGETSQVFIPSVNGNYGLIVTEGMCTDTSDCVQILTVGTASYQSTTLTLFPNPFSNELNIEIGGSNRPLKLEIINAAGQIVFTGHVSKRTSIQTHRFAPGVYFIKLEGKDLHGTNKILKE
jgi:hypothetical protein